MEGAFVHLDAGRRVLTTLRPPPPLPTTRPVPPGVFSIWQPDGPVDSVSWVMSPCLFRTLRGLRKEIKILSKDQEEPNGRVSSKQKAKGDMKTQ